ncbi:tyrosine--tRNA ligase [Candidatus Curtissbacteria bacterium RIFCSPLOWO2_01_FULL_37_9]|uniref:Tyrosine--tRNA ligase n=1 Tax=Candidatus Curtissbacteria bacterium RIFCSPLOWO2_01_FULL_37_9 TaxID=1797724 RepID=A0A1F5GUP6_9BACT|nr:MAG: tyrosine--tRNA ligase [Candidatus Curtissbacteria bacterium RIFCSPLOWO2_01_FULL_37_9]
MDKIEELLSRGVDQIIPSKQELEKVLRSGKKLRVYQGFDPSSPLLHIGHMIGMRKLRQWQDLGHEVIFLIGDFTGRIGDPTGREKTRPLLSKKTVEENAKTYQEQAGKILGFSGKNPVKIKFNSQWLEKLSALEILNLYSQVTYQQIIKRGMFKKRLEKDEDISFNEISYPIMQGYDSVAMDVDVEVGGRDQLFNMMIGRDLMHKMKRKNKFVMTTQLLVDTEGNKIGKTEGNAIALTLPPEDMFSAIMNLPDDVITKSLEYLTDVPMAEIKNIEADIKKGANPMQFKKKLAFDVVKQLNTKQAAQRAQKEFEGLFQKGGISDSIPTIKVKSAGIELVDFLVDNNLATSRSDAKRLIKEGAIEIDRKTVKTSQIQFENNQVIRVGKKIFAKIRILK